MTSGASTCTRSFWGNPPMHAVGKMASSQLKESTLKGAMIE